MGRFLGSVLVLGLVPLLLLVDLLACPRPAAPLTGCSQAALAVDGVQLTVTAPAIPGPFVLPEPGSALQVATASAAQPFLELSVTAVPYGARPPSEALPQARPGAATLYREALAAARRGQGASPQDGPLARLFGQEVAGSLCTVGLPVAGGQVRPVRIGEWVAEAGGRLWILRLAAEEGPDTFFAGLRLTSADLSAPSPSLAHARRPAPPVGSLAVDLPPPGWWHGECDTEHYQAQAGRPAYPLGAAYRGVKACGPRPWADGAPDVLVRFYPGAWGHYEWQCVELAMRYLYLAYGVPPYGANGKDVVERYAGTRLVQVWDGTAGQPPQPGDVISFGATTTYGHTVVVAASTVDGAGNGTIDTVSQDDTADGWRRYAVRGWRVVASPPAVGWLHDPRGPALVGRVWLPAVAR